VVARVEGEEFTLPFPAAPHWDLAETLDIIDFQTGASLSGSRFYLLSRERALAFSEPSLPGCWMSTPRNMVTPRFIPRT
jgi:hypothetical protein